MSLATNSRPETRYGNWLVIRPGIFIISGLLFVVACNGDDGMAETDDVDLTQEPTPTPTEVAADETPDVETIALEAGCDISPRSSTNDPWLTEVSPLWTESGSFRAAPSRTGDGNWYTGEATVAWWSDTQEEIAGTQVTGRNLDTGTAFEPAGIEFNYEVLNGAMAIAWIELAEAGCWELAIDDHQFVVWVQPEEEQPTLTFLREARAEIIAYDPPDDCEVTAWSGPRKAHGWVDGHWLETESFAVYSDIGIVFTTGTSIRVLTDDPNLEIRGSHASNPALSPQADIEIPGVGLRTLVDATLHFPLSGCWDLEFEANGETAEATVYVYPDACRRSRGSELSSDCIVPD